MRAIDDDDDDDDNVCYGESRCAVLRDAILGQATSFM